MPINSPGRGDRVSPGPTTAAFVIIVMAVGSVARTFGIEAGLLATLLAVVALVLRPSIYHSTGTPPVDSSEPEDGPDRDGP